DPEAVGGDHRRHRDPEPLAEPRLDGARPRRVDARAEERVHADAPVADGVAEALDDERAVVRDRARRLALLDEVADEVPRRPLVEPDLAQAGLGSRLVALAQLAHEASPGGAQLPPPAGRIALPEGHLPGLSR